MTYKAPAEDLSFLLEHVIGAERLEQTARFEDAGIETARAIIDEAAKLCDGVMAPLNRNGDLDPARLENGVVRASNGFKEGYKAIAEGGWVGIAASPDYGGMGLPVTLLTAVGDMMNGANLALALNPLLTQGQIEALEHHASDEIKNLYLPKLISGEWTGTMNLTESGAGSDVGALAAKAVDNGDGTFAVTGQKIFISWGDHDVAENICHLVLARLPDAPKGTKGISLFLVPKFIPDEAGNPGVANTLKAISLEHKMGLHGSPTAVMEFDGATGWMVGPENGGMAAMFTMMNNARLGVGVEGVGIAEGAYQKALAYAKERKQGRTPVGEGKGAIIDHADVRRMLATQKVLVTAARAICLDTAFSLDMAAAGDTSKDWKARAAFLTPIAKSFGTDIGSEVAELGIQIHGGMGYVEETGAAQYARDVRVTRIYEGTNGIQAMDLVGRKMMDGGVMANALMDEMMDTAESDRDLAGAVGSLRLVTQLLLDKPANARFTTAVDYQWAFALTLGGHYLRKCALHDPARKPLADFYTAAVLPRAAAHLAAQALSEEQLYAVTPEVLGA